MIVEMRPIEVKTGSSDPGDFATTQIQIQFFFNGTSRKVPVRRLQTAHVQITNLMCQFYASDLVIPENCRTCMVPVTHFSVGHPTPKLAVEI
jgi:hypothetical protein